MEGIVRGDSVEPAPAKLGEEEGGWRRACVAILNPPVFLSPTYTIALYPYQHNEYLLSPKPDFFQFLHSFLRHSPSLTTFLLYVPSFPPPLLLSGSLDAKSVRASPYVSLLQLTKFPAGPIARIR